jgi:hypothetical protein
MMNNPNYLTPLQVAMRWGITTNTLAIWRCRKITKLPYTKIGSKVRYRLKDVEKFEKLNLSK